MLTGDIGAEGLWLNDAGHRDFLICDARRALDLFDASPREGGGFHVLELDGRPQPGRLQEIHTTTRLVHSYGLAALAGRPDRAGIMDQGMDYLWSHHRDAQHGGYLWGLDGDAPVDRPKLAYGHVFVLLAASTAKMAGHPDADRLLADITEVIDRHYWDADAGLLRDEFTRDWQVFSGYRGMNANMHGVEALLAAHEATGDGEYLHRAGRILQFFIGGQAAAHVWRIPEHYHQDWTPDTAYAGDPMFRPAGTTPGHSFEMARLLLQWWDAAGRPAGDAVAQARALVDTALADAWDGERGGLAYTLKMDGGVDIADRYWWPVTEAIGALAALQKADPTPEAEGWYRSLWQFAADRFIDHEHGGWFPEIGPDDRPTVTQFAGKPDIYHALQADLLPLAGGLSAQATELSRTRPLAV
ncbi:AGE family epimerase/isomerase [Paracoccus sp. 1_MG-2023]|uniref:AGE family epimerase/isomerase n=1 Tax=unclassified Paracoccus (in: a-proteobacteria) TaxID=2688777 RepID=UPI001C083C77|nr:MULTISPECIES: AGE family epimerase/isomerase [unclassified Paracoccus (in: a-proteobacteria)]MBU2958730.1 AGE family epimerase/isomerase [Paracoccus sp. C2R09]MDO6667723.1 AGE family epimerase/isomerase [Paracoccus sp. 1_MG-2023]